MSTNINPNILTSMDQKIKRRFETLSVKNLLTQAIGEPTPRFFKDIPQYLGLKESEDLLELRKYIRDLKESYPKIADVSPEDIGSICPEFVELLGRYIDKMRALNESKNQLVSNIISIALNIRLAHIYMMIGSDYTYDSINDVRAQALNLGFSNIVDLIDELTKDKKRFVIGDNKKETIPHQN